MANKWKKGEVTGQTADLFSFDEAEDITCLLKLDLPLLLILPRKTKADKRYILNLNVYRNTHHRILNDVKQAYKEVVLGALFDAGATKLRIRDKMLHFVYTLYPPTRRRIDIANPLAIVQKFTDDALTDYKIITDDQSDVVRAVDYRYGSVSKDNPRAELKIYEWKE